jgi:hypothetical protein
LIGNRFDGFGSGPNVIPQARGLNRSWGAWYKMEDAWADDLERGRTIRVTIDLVGDEFRPSALVVQYHVDTETHLRAFVNEDIEC